jgi:hypothetical protein
MVGVAVTGARIHELMGMSVDCPRFDYEGRPPTDSVATGSQPCRARGQELRHSVLGVGGPALRQKRAGRDLAGIPLLISGFQAASISANSTRQAPIVQRKLWNYFRRFVRFLYGEKLIELPRNLEQRIFDFRVTPKEIKTYPTDLVTSMIAQLPDCMKLYALLALNCGMQGVDMASLRHEEYQNGRIRCKREKNPSRRERANCRISALAYDGCFAGEVPQVSVHGLRVTSVY